MTKYINKIVCVVYEKHGPQDITLGYPTAYDTETRTIQANFYWLKSLEQNICIPL